MQLNEMKIKLLDLQKKKNCYDLKKETGERLIKKIQIEKEIEIIEKKISEKIEK